MQRLLPLCGHLLRKRGQEAVKGFPSFSPEALPRGDEVVTRRYEFFRYLGPLDEETGEAVADRVGPDGVHGVGLKTINGVGAFFRLRQVHCAADA